MARGLPSAASLVRFCQKVNRVRPLEETTMETSLHRCLSTLDLTLLGVGGMVGSGIYVLTGTVAKELAGPAVIVSYAVAAVASLLAALCYAEFGARVPRTGSAYLFTYVSMGELWAFLIGWDVLLEYLIGGAAVARAWSGYLDAIFGHHIRNFTKTYVDEWQVPFLAPYPDFLATAILLLSSVLISCGARVSSWLNHTFSAISLGVILFTTVLGFILARPENWSSEEGGFAPFGFSGILAGTATCFYAFVGFDVIAASSEEAQNPRRAVPKAIAFSLGLAATAYILVSTVLTLMVPWHSLDPDSALADAFYLRGYSWAGIIVAVGSICAMNTVLLSNLFSLPRIAYAMAVDGLLFQVFAHVHPRTQVPVAAILVFGFLMATLALLLDLEALVQFLSIGTLLAYTFVAASVIVLRFRTASPPSSPGPASPSPGTKEPSSFSDRLQLVAPEPGRLRPALRPYLGFLDRYGHGTAVAWALGLLVASAVTLGCVLNFGDSVLHLPRWGYILLLLSSGVVFLLSLAILGAHQQQHRQDIFQVPLVPLTPALSILLNICLVLQLSHLTWLRFCIWLLIGLTVYFTYGFWHSKQNLPESSGLAAARYVVFPNGTLVETVQAVQPPCQPPAQEPGHTEQPAKP
ncbi:cationic amino acid transporter 4-like [Choloepus didactylus]|uniref:cationic amino acid transporter 4-like n=1 Tax=Choloepus didactylus TaxID=27675 RepID=UPI00189D88AB|nr:cationic amino acid transporter 4-like [Choloepus didactylus]XP_037679602.1 cationic amino acid transporter 4-like [Choloepus didactylus]XP_037679603.1 cationic amino acid transporter 4-like [Choloepus didactylus]